ncbi:MAG: dihydrofolate reductase family protein [Actinomycetes bacterium]
MRAHPPRARRPPHGGWHDLPFVTAGLGEALNRARRAGDRDVAIAGGASTINQYLAAGAIEQLHLHIAPIVLGAGERLSVGVGDIELTPVGVVGSPGITHVRYRVG